MQNVFSRTVLASFAFFAAAGAQATVIDFEQPIGADNAPFLPLLGNGDTFVQRGFLFAPFSIATGAQAGDLVAAIVDGGDPSTCSGVVCPGNDASHYFASLNDGAVAILANDGGTFTVQGFDASFVGSGEDLAAAPFFSGFIRLIGYEPGYETSVTATYGLEGASSSGALNFNSYDVGGTVFGSTPFVEVDAFGFYCPASGDSCLAFSTNKGQFALDNIGVTATNAVPEPAEWALMGAGLALVAGAARLRRRS